MNHFKLTPLLIAIIALTAISCKNDSPESPTYTLRDYPDVLNLVGTPAEPEDESISVLTDQGAWFGFSLAGDKKVGFSGPYQLSDSWRDPSIWQGPSFARLQLTDASDSTTYVKQEVTNHSYPGRLQQVIDYGAINATLELIFADEQTALIRARLHNQSDQEQMVQTHWNSTFFDSNTKTSFNNGLLEVQPGSGPAPFYLSTGQSFTFDRNSEGYRLSSANPTTIEAGDTAEQYLSYSLSKEVRATADKGTQHFQSNKKRWNRYVQTLTGANITWNGDENRRRVAVKSLQTLITNWRSAYRDLHYDGLFPSYAYQGFHGIWSWDSWKHATALALFAPELAKDQMRVMFDYQNKAGMVPDVIYADSTENNWRDTKPPLASWAVWKIYQQIKDTAFLKEMYPKLKRYHRWWYQDRDHDGNGLCEYGSTDGTRIAAAWESGMDNAVRFDEAVMIKNSESAWSLDQESVDLNAYLYAEKGFLAQMAELLGETDEASNFREEAEILKDQINQTMYDAESGYYYDKKLESDSLITVAGPEGWIPLWAGIADKQQAKSVRDMMMDTSRFQSKVPLPTLQVSHPKFNPRDGYWRGPVWLDQFYFGVKGLSDYGFSEEASKLTALLLKNAEGLQGSSDPIRENYHPVTGEGLNARHFSWSAAHLLLLSRVPELTFPATAP